MLLGHHKRSLLLVLTTTVLLSACGAMDKLAPGREKIDYKKSKTIDTLEVPPDLSSNTIAKPPGSLEAAGATFSEFGGPQTTRERTSVMPAQVNVEVRRDRDQQWLVVQGTPEQVWPRAKEFWLQEGFSISKEDPRVGILETEWAENRADIPQGPIRGLLGKALDNVYSSATRDKFRMRLEQGEGNTVEVFLTHRGVEEVVTGGNLNDETTVWQSRPTDPELEAEMLKRMLVFLGTEERRAESMLAKTTEQPARAELMSFDTGSLLLIREDYSRAWRRTGVALDRVGFTVEDRDRDAGTYFVRYSDPLSGQNKESGFLDKLAFWSSDEEVPKEQFRIRLFAAGEETRVIVYNSAGQRDTSSSAKRILSLLEEQLR